MIQPERIKKLNERDARKGDYVLYWMQQSQRVDGNHALEHAIAEANARRLPAVVGFGLQLWISSVAYPLNIGGRPYNSWPAFIPVTFELTILLAAFAAVVGMFSLNRLPEPYHPVFNVPGFERATQDRCFLLIEAQDPKFDVEETRAFLEGLGPEEVSHVET